MNRKITAIDFFKLYCFTYFISLPSYSTVMHPNRMQKEGLYFNTYIIRNTFNLDVHFIVHPLLI